MTKHLRRPGDDEPTDKPSIEQCLFHRCARHLDVRQLNANEATAAECGACVAEIMLTLKAQLLFTLDGYADRMAYASALRRQLTSARDRLNLLSPGAGNEFTLAEQEPDEEPT